MLVAQNHPKGMFLTRMRFEWSFVVRERKLFCVFLFFFWLKTTRVRKMFVFCETLIKSGCLSLMSLSSSILRILYISDNKDDNNDDTRGEKELRPPRIRAAV